MKWFWFSKPKTIVVSTERRIDSESRARVNKEEFAKAEAKIKSTMQKHRAVDFDALATMVKQLQEDK